MRALQVNAAILESVVCVAGSLKLFVTAYVKLGWKNLLQESSLGEVPDWLSWRL